MRNLKMTVCLLVGILLAWPVFFGESLLAAKPEFTLRYADPTAPTGAKGKGFTYAIEKIEKDSNGRIAIEPYWSSSLMKTQETLTGLKNGVADIAFICTSWYSSQLPANQLPWLLFDAPSGEGIYDFQRRLFSEIPELKEELRSWNQKWLSPAFAGDISGVCTVKNVTSFDGLKGLKIRSGGGLARPRQVKAMGAVSVEMAFIECASGLQSGVIEGVYTGLDCAHRDGLLDAAPYWFAIPKGTSSGHNYIAINIDTWNKLPPDLQKIVQDGFVAGWKCFSDTMIGQLNYINDNVIKGFKWITNEEYQRYMASPYIMEIEKYGVEQTKKKIPNAEAILSKIKEISKELGGGDWVKLMEIQKAWLKK